MSSISGAKSLSEWHGRDRDPLKAPGDSEGGSMGRGNTRSSDSAVDSSSLRVTVPHLNDAIKYLRDDNETREVINSTDTSEEEVDQTKNDDDGNSLMQGDVSVAARELSDEIAQGIINLCGISEITMRRAFSSMRDIARQHRVPALRYSLLLFRKYADIANDIKDTGRSSNGNSSGQSSPIDFTSLIPDSDHQKQTGILATTTYLFWHRVLCSNLALLSWMLMANVPYITYADFHPYKYFSMQCQITIVGSFNMRPFQLVLVCGVLINLYTFLLALYYLLPVDKNRRKYLPGCKRHLQSCVGDKQWLRDCCSALYDGLGLFSTFLEFFIDSILLLLSMLSFIVSVVAVDKPSRFSVYKELIVQYYSLDSFYMTYSNTINPCFEKELTPLIRSSIAVLFFCSCSLALCWQSSLRAFRSQYTRKQLQGRYRSAAIDGEANDRDDDLEAIYAAPVPIDLGEEEEEDEEDDNNEGLSHYPK